MKVLLLALLMVAFCFALAALGTSVYSVAIGIADVAAGKFFVSNLQMGLLLIAFGCLVVVRVLDPWLDRGLATLKR